MADAPAPSLERQAEEIVGMLLVHLWVEQRPRPEKPACDALIRQVEAALAKVVRAELAARDQTIAELRAELAESQELVTAFLEDRIAELGPPTGKDWRETLRAFGFVMGRIGR